MTGKKCPKCGSELYWYRKKDGDYNVRCPNDSCKVHISISYHDVGMYEQYAPKRDAALADWIKEKMDSEDD